jgi:hypothetical protein
MTEEEIDAMLRLCQTLRDERDEALARIEELEHYIASREGGKRLTPDAETGKVGQP